MFKIVIMSDTLKQDDKIVETIKNLFPESNVQIFSKTSEKLNDAQMHSKKNALAARINQPV